MGAAILALAALSGLQTGLEFGQHQKDAQAASMRGRLQNDIAERNAQLAERQGRDALNRGAMAEGRERLETRQQIGSTRAALAAQGIDVNGGSAAEVQATERLIGDVDALMIRSNAQREAWGFDVEAANERTQGRFALLAGENEAAAQRVAGVSTLLGGVANLYSINGMRAPKSKSVALPKASRAPDVPPGWRTKGYG